MFDDILEKNKAFLEYKKIGIFPKGSVHGFSQKIENLVFFSRISSNKFSWSMLLKRKRWKIFEFFDQTHGRKNV